MSLWLLSDFKGSPPITSVSFLSSSSVILAHLDRGHVFIHQTQEHAYAVSKQEGGSVNFLMADLDPGGNRAKLHPSSSILPRMIELKAVLCMIHRRLFKLSECSAQRQRARIKAILEDMNVMEDI